MANGVLLHALGRETFEKHANEAILASLTTYIAEARHDCCNSLSDLRGSQEQAWEGGMYRIV